MTLFRAIPSVLTNLPRRCATLIGMTSSIKAPVPDKLAAEFNFEPPRRHGYATVNAIQAMHAGRARIFLAMGGNFLSATPDTQSAAEALRRCRLTAHVSTKLNRAPLVTGELA